MERIWIWWQFKWIPNFVQNFSDVCGRNQKTRNRIDKKKKKGKKIERDRGGGGKLQLELVKLQMVSGIAVHDPAQLAGGNLPLPFRFVFGPWWHGTDRELGFSFWSCRERQMNTYTVYSVVETPTYVDWKKGRRKCKEQWINSCSGWECHIRDVHKEELLLGRLCIQKQIFQCCHTGCSSFDVIYHW